MAYGLHWEWRGFGELDPLVRRRIEDLPRLIPGDLQGVDSYYWFPGCDVNLKVRDWGSRAGVKLKRLLEVDDVAQLELWLEDEREDFPFPLRAESVSTVAAALGVEVAPPLRPMGRCSLLTLLREARPDLVVVAVHKARSLRRLGVGDRELSVELAEVTAPEHLTSVGLEDRAGLSGASSPEDQAAAKRDLLDARDALGLPGGLAPLSYLAAVGAWATGRALLTE